MGPPQRQALESKTAEDPSYLLLIWCKGLIPRGLVTKPIYRKCQGVKFTANAMPGDLGEPAHSHTLA